MIRQLLRPSLFRRLFGWQLGMVLIALTLNFAWSVWSQVYAPGKGAIDRDMRLQVDALAGFAAQNVTPAHATAVAQEIGRLVQGSSEFTSTPEDFGWQVWRADGTLLSSDHLPGSFAPMPPGTLVAHARQQRGDWLVMGGYSRDRSVWTVVGQTRSFYSQLDHKLMRQALAVPLVYAVVVLLTLWLAAWRGLLPLADLGARIGTRQAGDTRPLNRGQDEWIELQPITFALDAYAQREAALRQQAQRFFADAAHELRTPLAVIGAQAHVLSQEQHPERQAEALARLQQSVQRGGEVLSKVLTLSRLDTGRVIDAAESEPIDLGSLLADGVAEQAPRAWLSGHNLGLLPGPAVGVCGQRHLLRTAVDNLIDNALRYTPRGCRIDVSWGVLGDQAWCAVEDDGPGIEAVDHARVFGRFERGEKVHAQGQSGSGLGLAIAREIARQHQGTLHLVPANLGSGCRFMLTLPQVGQGSP